MATRKEPQKTRTKGPPATPRTLTPAEYQVYVRGYEEGRRAGIKFERERIAHRGPLLRLPEVLRLTGLSRATLDRLERRVLFPRRTQITENAVGWFERDVQAWTADLPSADEKDFSPEDHERRLRGELAIFRIPDEPPRPRRSTPPRRPRPE